MTTISEALAIALQHHQSGYLSEAEEIYRQILQQQPYQIDALHLLGVIACQVGRVEEGIAHYIQVLTLQPNHPQVHYNLGTALQQQGRLAEATVCYQQAVALQPDYPIAHYNLGMAFQAQGRVTEAIACYRQALSLQPNLPEVCLSLGSALQSLGELAEARICYDQVLALQPNSADAYLGLGQVQQQQGEADQAIATYQRAIALEPSWPPPYYQLGTMLQAQGKLTEAIVQYQQALSLQPSYVAAHLQLGAVLSQQGRLREAIAYYQQAIGFQPDLPEVHYYLGQAWAATGQVEQAIAAYQQAITLNPDYAPAYAPLADLIQTQGQLEQAIVYYRKALELGPDNAAVHSRLLLALQASSACDPATLFQEHQRWGQQYGADSGAGEPYEQDRNPNRRLRIGYVSSHFCNHPDRAFLEPILASHNWVDFEVVAYAAVVHPDSVTAHYQSLLDEWRDISTLTDAAAAAQIRQDQIDILVDLDGHTPSNRLLLFAPKPAPVQVTYLGYPDTTGLAAMDYRLTDAWADPVGSADDRHTETLIRLSDGYLCFHPPADAPDIGPLPAKATATITFGCCAPLAKIRPEVVVAWSRILQALPYARLVLQNPAFRDASTQERFYQRFAEYEISQGRVDLLSPAEAEHPLAVYNQIDIALDPFPYNGRTTTCEALWMGVPVVVLAGETHASSIGVSLLSSIGLSELVADSVREYITLAIRLADDQAQLEQYRQELREVIASAPLTDAVMFTQSLEAAYRQIWQEWCRATP